MKEIVCKNCGSNKVKLIGEYYTCDVCGSIFHNVINDENKETNVSNINVYEIEPDRSTNANLNVLFSRLILTKELPKDFFNSIANINVLSLYIPFLFVDRVIDINYFGEMTYRKSVPIIEYQEEEWYDYVVGKTRTKMVPITKESYQDDVKPCNGTFDIDSKFVISLSKLFEIDVDTANRAQLPLHPSTLIDHDGFQYEISDYTSFKSLLSEAEKQVNNRIKNKCETEIYKVLPNSKVLNIKSNHRVKENKDFVIMCPINTFIFDLNGYSSEIFISSNSILDFHKFSHLFMLHGDIPIEKENAIKEKDSFLNNVKMNKIYLKDYILKKEQ